MAAEGFHLAQVNIALVRAPIDSPTLIGFVAALDPVNAIADSSAGFVWRLQTEDGDATAIRPFDDDRIMVNMSVWESLAALKAFVADPAHLAIMRRRREWFHHMAEAYLALWWVPAGTTPTVADAKERIAHLRHHGPSTFAFDFRHPYPAPGATAADADSEDWTGCPAG